MKELPDSESRRIFHVIRLPYNATKALEEFISTHGGEVISSQEDKTQNWQNEYEELLARIQSIWANHNEEDVLMGFLDLEQAISRHVTSVRDYRGKHAVMRFFEVAQDTSWFGSEVLELFSSSLEQYNQNHKDKPYTRPRGKRKEGAYGYHLDTPVSPRDIGIFIDYFDLEGKDSLTIQEVAEKHGLSSTNFLDRKISLLGDALLVWLEDK